MSILKEIQENLRIESEKMTYDEMSKKYGVPKSSLNEFISGKKKIANMPFGTFQKLFPNATINLTGNHQTARDAAIINNGQANTINGGHIGSDCRNEVEQLVLNNETLSNDDKIKFLKILKNQ